MNPTKDRTRKSSVPTWRNRAEYRRARHQQRNFKRNLLRQQERDGLTKKAVAYRKKMKAHRRRNGQR